MEVVETVHLASELLFEFKSFGFPLGEILARLFALSTDLAHQLKVEVRLVFLEHGILFKESLTFLFSFLIFWSASLDHLLGRSRMRHQANLFILSQVLT